VKEVLEFLDKIPRKTEVVLTGRFAPIELVKLAEFVNEIIAIKCPKEMVTTRGIQY